MKKQTLCFRLALGFAAVTISMISGCESASVKPLSADALPPKPADCKITVYGTDSHPDRPFTKIAKLDYKTNSIPFNEQTRDAVVKGLQKEACDVGADGMILQDAESGAWTNGKQGNGSAIAIKFE